MTLLIIVFTLAFIQIWDRDIPLHKDRWLINFVAWLSEQKISVLAQYASLIVVAVAVFGVFLTGLILSSISSWLLLPFGILVLLYSIGRNEYMSILREFTQACEIDDWDASIARAEVMGVNTESIAANSWAELYGRVLEAAAYRGFERTFAVLFWFFIFGPAGALLYRLLFLLVDKQAKSDALTAKMLWLLEWPAVRTLGLSFAITGNFVGCLGRWKQRFLCPKSRTEFILMEATLGALSVTDDIQADCDVTRTELMLLRGLFVRTLWFWLAAISLVLLFF